MPKKTVRKRLVCHDLVNLAARDAESFAMLCETQYAARISAAADAVLAGPARLVMLTGPSGVGKTTSANRLAAAIRERGKPCVVVSLDDFFVGEGRYPKRPDGSDDYECPEALDLPALRAFMAALVRDGRATSPIFDFITQLPSVETRSIDCAGGVAVIEGLHALNPLLSEGLPAGAVFYIYASLREEYCGADGKRSVETRELRLARRITRDNQFRGHAPDFTLALWDHVCASERQYVQAFKERADLILDTAFSYEPCLWGKVLGTIADQTAPDYRERFERLRREFAPFTPLDSTLVPAGSMLREFLGPKV